MTNWLTNKRMMAARLAWVSYTAGGRFKTRKWARIGLNKRAHTDEHPVKMVEAAGVEPASQTNLPAATTCLVRKDFSAMR
jgi:hypothetical protein